MRRWQRIEMDYQISGKTGHVLANGTGYLLSRAVISPLEQGEGEAYVLQSNSRWRLGRRSAL